MTDLAICLSRTPLIASELAYIHRFEPGAVPRRGMGAPLAGASAAKPGPQGRLGSSESASPAERGPAAGMYSRLKGRLGQGVAIDEKN